MQINTFEEAENFLKKRRKYGVKPGLKRIKRMLPVKRNDLFVVHIAGTNGKGTVQAYIEKGLLDLDSELKVAKFTSPSLSGYLGHFYLNDKKVKKTDFVYALNQLLPKIKSLDAQGEHPTEFEIITALTLPLFNETADILLLEVGMGGRYDTTNALATDLPIITSISYDHTDYLGRELSDIASHKAGIIQSSLFAICGLVDSDLKVVIQSENSYKTKIYFVDEENKSLSSPSESNLEVALTAIKYIASKLNINYNSSVKNDLLKKLNQLVIPGRYEQIYSEPKILIDGAHNVASMEALVEYYGQTTKQMHLVISAFKDKDLEGMLKVVENQFKSIHLTTFEHERARTETDLNQFNYPLKLNYEEVLDEITLSESKNETYLFTGSVYFISLIRDYLKSKKE